jgi:hypothetical protein
LQSEDSSRSFILVEGFSILASQLISGAFTVVLAVFMRGAPSGVLLADRACVSTQLELLLYQVPLFVVFTITHIFFSSYIHLDLKLVFPGGVLSRVMLTKNTVSTNACY